LVLLAVSIFIGVFGGKMFSPVISVLGCFAGFAAVFVTSSIFLLINTVVGFWVTIGLGLVLGGLLALLLYKTKKL